MDIKERIIEFLRKENISSANFAQEIGVQPSGISHIISGRNKPSLDFIVKMLHRYPHLSTEWLLFGKGQMLNQNIQADLFSEDLNAENPPGKPKDPFEVSGPALTSPPVDRRRENEPGRSTGTGQSEGGHSSARIVIFYHDGTFAEYFPA